MFTFFYYVFPLKFPSPSNQIVLSARLQLSLNTQWDNVDFVRATNLLRACDQLSLNKQRDNVEMISFFFIESNCGC